MKDFLWKLLAAVAVVALAWVVVPWEDIQSSRPAQPTEASSATQSIPAYDRDEFGHGWATDDTGCTTRQQILRRDLTEVTLADDGCVILTGKLTPDPYTGADLHFAHDRVGGDSGAIQIDHIVPLSVAWRMGAHAWTPEERVAFSNDPANLIAVSGPANNSKGDRTPERWLPVEDFHCEYAARYQAVSDSYHLTIEPQVEAALQAVLAQC